MKLERSWFKTLDASSNKKKKTQSGQVHEKAEYTKRLSTLLLGKTQNGQLMTERELISKFRNPEDKYLVFIDDNEKRVTTNNIRGYLQRIIIEKPEWNRMTVYFRYGISWSQIIYPIDQIIDEDLNIIKKDVELKSVRIATYKNTYLPYGPNPSERDVEGFYAANKEAIRAWRLIVRKKFDYTQNRMK